MENSYVVVHTMTDYYDGPRRGIADFRGKPHIYESLWEEDGDLDVFLVSPVDPELFRKALEDWSIWLRWEAAFHAGQTTQATHPALPEDRARHEELNRVLEEHLHIDRESAIKVAAKFRIRNGVDKSVKGFLPLEVLWTEIAEKE